MSSCPFLTPLRLRMGRGWGQHPGISEVGETEQPGHLALDLSTFIVL